MHLQFPTESVEAASASGSANITNDTLLHQAKGELLPFARMNAKQLIK
jgi:hypothetical protein